MSSVQWSAQQNPANWDDDPTEVIDSSTMPGPTNEEKIQQAIWFACNAECGVITSSFLGEVIEERDVPSPERGA